MNTYLRTIRTQIFALALLSLLASPVQAQDNPQKIDLNGTWTTDDGESVKVVQSGQSVNATFLSGGGCPYGGGRSYLFRGQLRGTSLKGTMMACTKVKALVDDCHLESANETKFNATTAQDTISGERFGEGWGYDTKDGHWLNCHLDDQFSGWTQFSLKRACDPNLWADYERKKKVAAELFQRSNKMGEEIVKEAHDYFSEEMGMMGEIGGVKGPILARIEHMHEWGLEHMAQTRGELAQAYLNGSRVTGAVVKGVEVYGSIIPTALWLTEMGEKSVEIEKEMDQREKMGQQAAALLDSALRDFKADFNQRHVCEEQDKKLRAEEALNDEAKKKMEEWDYSPSGDLYRTPSGEVLDAAAALKRAKQILTGQSSSSLQPSPIIQLASYSSFQPQDLRVTCDQLSAAIGEIDGAMKAFDKGMNGLSTYYASEDNHQAQIAQLLSHFEASEKSSTTGAAGAIRAPGTKSRTQPTIGKPAPPRRRSRTLRP